MHVMKMGQALAQEGHQVRLTAKKSWGAMAPDKGYLMSHYGLERLFPIRLIPYHRLTMGLDYDIRSVLWAKRPGCDMIYTRSIRAALFATAIGHNTIFEAHNVPAGSLGAWYFRRILNNCNLSKVVAITHALKKLLLENFSDVLYDDRVIVAPDGVDLERFSNRPTKAEARLALNLDPQDFVAGYVGHLYPGRGVEQILDIAKRSHDIVFLFVGGTPQDIANRKRQAAEMALDNVRIVGFVANSELPTFYAACDVLLMPYQREVAVSGGGNTANYMSPMKMFEYMATGRMIIASDLPVLREILDDTNAVLCDPDDIPAWRNALQRAKIDAEWSLSLAVNASAKVENFTWKRRVQNIFHDFTPAN